MATLRSKVIRLAHANPELRPHLLPILVGSANMHLAGVDMRSPTPEEIQSLRKFVNTVIKGASVKAYKSSPKAKTTVEIRPPYPSKGGGDSLVRIVGYLIENGWVTFPYGDTSSLETLAKNAEKFNAFYPLGNLMVKAD